MAATAYPAADLSSGPSMDIGSFLVAGDAQLRVEEAWNRLSEAVPPLGRMETVRLAEADGRVLAETVTSAVALQS